MPSRSKPKAEYDPLMDPNLASHFGNPLVQRQLLSVGIVRTA